MFRTFYVFITSINQIKSVTISKYHNIITYENYTKENYLFLKF